MPAVSAIANRAISIFTAPRTRRCLACQARVAASACVTATSSNYLTALLSRPQSISTLRAGVLPSHGVASTIRPEGHCWRNSPQVEHRVQHLDLEPNSPMGRQCLGNTLLSHKITPSSPGLIQASAGLPYTRFMRFARGADLRVDCVLPIFFPAGDCVSPFCAPVHKDWPSPADNNSDR